MKVSKLNIYFIKFLHDVFAFQAGLVLCLLSTVLVPGLAGHSVFSLQTAQPTELTSECAEVSTELCDICGAFADAALNILLTILHSEC